MDKILFYEAFLLRSVSPFVMQVKGEPCGDVLHGDVAGRLIAK